MQITKVPNVVMHNRQYSKSNATKIIPKVNKNQSFGSVHVMFSAKTWPKMLKVVNRTNYKLYPLGIKYKLKGNCQMDTDLQGSMGIFEGIQNNVPTNTQDIMVLGDLTKANFDAWLGELVTGLS